MGVSSYDKNGRLYWQVYVDLRSRKDRQVRLQRRITGFETERAAVAEERKLVRELSEQLTTLEAKGLRWRDVIDRWQRHQELYPTHRYVQTTVKDYGASLKKWTKI